MRISQTQVLTVKLGQHGARDQYVTSEMFLQKRNVYGWRNPNTPLGLGSLIGSWYWWMHGTFKGIG